MPTCSSMTSRDIANPRANTSLPAMSPMASPTRNWRPDFTHSGVHPMEIACLDLEGVLIPEIWIAFADKAGIPDLRLTTRDIPDYDVLMKQRLRILAEHGLGLKEIQEVIATMQPIPGAAEFVSWLRKHFQVVILSDTFYEFAMPMMPLLGNPTLLCHKLVVDEKGKVVDYVIRQKDPK